MKVRMLKKILLTAVAIKGCESVLATGGGIFVRAVSWPGDGSDGS